MKPLRIVPLCLLIASGPLLADEGGKKTKPAKQSVPATTSTKSEGKQDFVPGGVASSFVIPKNTCESGVSIQKLLTDKPDKTK